MSDLQEPSKKYLCPSVVKNPSKKRQAGKSDLQSQVDIIRVHLKT